MTFDIKRILSKIVCFFRLFENNARPGEIRRFALDQLVSSAHPLNPAAAKTHRSEPVGGMERIEHNLLMEGSENLIALLGTFHMENF